MDSQSSLEEMLESIKLRVKKPSDLPPALPTRPTSMSRRPTSRFQALQKNFSAKKEDVILQDRRDYLDMKKAAATLQSFIRGEIARYNLYVSLKRQRAALVIQKHVKQWIAKESADDQQREIAALSSERSSWKVPKTHRVSEENLPSPIKENGSQHPLMRISVAELQRRVIDAEVALKEKEEEIALLRGKLQESEKRYLEYEKNMKSMEQAWQKQLDSLQMSIASSDTSLMPDNLTNYQRLPDSSPTMCHYYDCEDGIYDGNRTPEKAQVKQPTDACQISNSNCTKTSVGHLAKEFDQRMQVFEDDAGFLVQANSGQESSYINSTEELRKLKVRFTSWEKDYKARLRETKASLKKHSNSEERRTCKSSSSNQREELHKLKARFTSWEKDYKSRLKEAKATLKKLNNSDEKICFKKNSEEKNCFKKNSEEKRTWKIGWWKRN